MHRCVLILKVHSNSYEEKNSDKRHLIITRTGATEHHDLPVPPSHPPAGHQGRGLPRPPDCDSGPHRSREDLPGRGSTGMGAPHSVIIILLVFFHFSKKQRQN